MTDTLELDNNIAEQAMRSVAIERKIICSSDHKPAARPPLSATTGLKPLN